jgi:hypothetical protein
VQVDSDEFRTITYISKKEKKNTTDVPGINTVKHYHQLHTGVGNSPALPVISKYERSNALCFLIWPRAYC